MTTATRILSSGLKDDERFKNALSSCRHIAITVAASRVNHGCNKRGWPLVYLAFSLVGADGIEPPTAGV
ncbi:hypothetical protein BST40_10450 [Mycobacterium persicum]|nr:hypothetical protein BST40_10450 [Mycobacterium persicum]